MSIKFRLQKYNNNGFDSACIPNDKSTTVFVHVCVSVCLHLCSKESKHSINCYFGVFDNIIYSDFRLIDVVILRPIEKYHLNGRSAGAHKRLATQNKIHSTLTHEHTHKNMCAWRHINSKRFINCLHIDLLFALHWISKASNSFFDIVFLAFWLWIEFVCACVCVFIPLVLCVCIKQW